MRSNHQKVAIEDTKLDTVLSEAFRRPETLAETGNFVTNYQRFAVRPNTSPDAEPRALIVGWQTRAEFVAYFVMTIVLLSAGTGVSMGFLAHEASIGLAVSSGLATLLSCIEVLIFWLFR